MWATHVREKREENFAKEERKANRRPRERKMKVKPPKRGVKTYTTLWGTQILGKITINILGFK